MDQLTAVIGEVGRWQLENILLVFIAAAPGKIGYLRTKWHLAFLVVEK